MKKFTFKQLLDAAATMGEIRQGDARYVWDLYRDSSDAIASQPQPSLDVKGAAEAVLKYFKLLELHSDAYLATPDKIEQILSSFTTKNRDGEILDALETMLHDDEMIIEMGCLTHEVLVRQAKTGKVLYRAETLRLAISQAMKK